MSIESRQRQILSRSLRTHVLRATAWSGFDLIARQGIQFVISIVLARLITPKEFGLVGMLMVFTALGQALVECGFGSVLIQSRELKEIDKSTAFLFSLGSGLFMYFTLYATAPAIASFYRIPILTPLARVIAISFIFNGLCVVQLALLSRELDFKTQSKIGLAATAISGGLAVWMAKKGMGVWSLAFQSVCSAGITAAVVWILHPWHPTWGFSRASWVRQFRFGSRMLATALVASVSERGQLVLIGKIFSAADLGLYTRAYSTQQTGSSLIVSIFSRVAFPLFSSKAGDPKALKAAAKKVLVTSTMVTVPLMIGLGASARILVATLFGQKWLPCVPYLEVLSLAGALAPLQTMNLTVLLGLGRSDLILRLEIIRKCILAASILTTCWISVMAMTWGVLAFSVLSYFVNAVYTRKLIGYGSLEQMKDISSLLLASAGMGVLVHVLSRCLDHSALSLAGLVLFGGVCFGILCRALKVELPIGLVREALGYGGGRATALADVPENG